MSAAFRLAAKKKFNQNDLRRLMAEQKAQKAQNSTPVVRIDSPLAKYNDLGQLTCVLCSSIVRSEAVWKVHVNTKLHKENIQLAKQLKEKTKSLSTSTTITKRPATPPPTTPAKKLKGILKKSDENDLPEDFFEGKSNSIIRKDLVNINRGPGSGDRTRKEEAMETGQQAEAASQPEVDEQIPEGFFDDPKLDAKARHLEYKDPNDEEWERFQKVIKEEINASTAIISEEQEEATNERQIEEIDEQMRIWSRVLDLEKKREEVVATAKVKQEPMDEDVKQESDSDDEDDADIDEFLDWRAKMSHK